MRFTPIAATPCSTRRSAFGRGRASSRRTGAGAGGGRIAAAHVQRQRVVVERDHRAGADLAVEPADPQRVADRGAMHLAHVPQAAIR